MQETTYIISKFEEKKLPKCPFKSLLLFLCDVSVFQLLNTKMKFANNSKALNLKFRFILGL